MIIGKKGPGMTSMMTDNLLIKTKSVLFAA